jgi:hypothetical protein
LLGSLANIAWVLRHFVLFAHFVIDLVEERLQIVTGFELGQSFNQNRTLKIQTLALKAYCSLICLITHWRILIKRMANQKTLIKLTREQHFIIILSLVNWFDVQTSL